MDAPKTLNDYESLSDLTSQMRSAALQGEWDKLLGLEQQCSQHLTAMRPAVADDQLDEPVRQRKIQLIKKILADDAVIRNHTEVWIEQLQSIMRVNRQD